MTRQWGCLFSALPAFINGYDQPALNAPEQRRQSARTMAEEDGVRIRILQSLRGKICKFSSSLTAKWGEVLGEEASGEKGKPEGRGVLPNTADSVEARGGHFIWLLLGNLA